MKLALWIVLTLVGVGVAVWMIGWSLPVKHRSVVTRGPEFESVNDWTTWRTDLRRLEMAADARAVVTDAKGSVRYRIEQPADRTLVTTIDQDGLPYGGRWTWSVRPAEGGVSRSLTIEAEGEIYNPVFGIVSCTRSKKARNPSMSSCSRDPRPVPVHLHQAHRVAGRVPEETEDHEPGDLEARRIDGPSVRLDALERLGHVDDAEVNSLLRRILPNRASERHRDPRLELSGFVELPPEDLCVERPERPALRARNVEEHDR